MNAGIPWLSAADSERLLAEARRASFVPGAAIVTEGAPQGDLFVLVSGYARVERRGGGAGGIAIARLGPGEAFGEMSLLEDSPASASVIAEEPVVAHAIAGDDVRRLLAADPGFSARFHRALAVSLSARLRSTTTQLAELGATDVPTAPRRRSVLTGHVTERQIPSALTDAVAELHSSLWAVEERLLKGERFDAQPLVNAACERMLASFARTLEDGSLVEAGYDDLLAFRDPSGLATGFGAYLFRQAFPLLMASATMARCHAKASGYAGDPDTIDRIYADAPDGDGILGRHLDRWFLGRPFCRARREARARLAARLRDLRAGAGQAGPVRALALTCRAPREILDALAGTGAGLRATCFDGDQAALRHAADLAARAHVADALSLVHANVARLAEGHGAVAIGPQDCIYGLGTADGLDDDNLVRVLDWSHGHLAPGGALVLTGTLPDHPDWLLMEHVLEWHVNARTPDQLRSLVGRSRFGGSALVEVDDEGVLTWLTATR